MNFSQFKTAVGGQFETLRKQPLFRADVTGDDLWNTYINSFPPGTNPLVRVRTEHDCSCCRQFIRAVGNAVAVVNGKVVSIWDVEIPGEPAYQVVADAMAKLVKDKAIDNIFLHTERSAGTEKSFEQVLDKVQTWNHFHVQIPNDFVCRGVDIGPKRSEARALYDVMLRSLTEITDEAVDTVLDLIAQNALYRGTEHTFVVDSFRKLKAEFRKLEQRQATTAEKSAFVWSKINTVPASVAKVRNTSIGTLLIDLSEGLELEQAVRKFDAVMAPANYKRPTALVSKKMIENAKATLESLGLISALDRRYARLADINVNDIIFADRTARKSMIEGDVFDVLASETKVGRTPSLDRVDEIPVDKFMSEIVPRAQSVEIMVENRHISNLVSLIAPVDPTGGKLFKWDNNFSWSYNGDVADSIKERVKRAGGNVTGDLCCRLAWFNYDDLDLHMRQPNGEHIYFGHREDRSSGGKLDVDMNAGGGTTREPVENIFYTSRRKMPEGVYELFVNNYHKRESTNVGFEVEIDYLGTVRRFVYDKAVGSTKNVPVAKFRYTHAGGIEFLDSLPSTESSKTVWNVKTGDFAKVNVLMRSPNYWGDRGVGNQHYFFMLDGCQNDGTARGFYNEFLSEALTPHRKVIEMVGAKMRTEESVDQLSGLGFSTTQRADVIARVKGSFTRNVKIVF